MFSVTRCFNVTIVASRENDHSRAISGSMYRSLVEDFDEVLSPVDDDNDRFEDDAGL